MPCTTCFHTSSQHCLIPLPSAKVVVGRHPAEHIATYICVIYIEGHAGVCVAPTFHHQHSRREHQPTFNFPKRFHRGRRVASFTLSLLKAGMRSSTTALALILAFCAGIAPTRGDPPCPNQCRFTFCPVQGPLQLKNADEPITYQICARNTMIYVGNVCATGEAYVFNGTSYVTMSQYKPPGLAAKFLPTFWKTYSFPRTHEGKTFQVAGVGHEKLVQNQADFLHAKCYILPLRHYELLDAPFGNVVSHETTYSTFSDCVSYYLE